ncbi:COMPASS component Swd3p [[Candida] jaroonii]|uniref:COMPASS component Swd3p n=1 Tax=[Candida] jaroonii TaxID=467808 RepID=A0ACA9YBL6_9ASCO|nr:COMPASS component Swd3p [[Candida] jaroonii]
MYSEVLKINQSCSVNAVKVSPDEKTFATCNSDGIITIYDFEGTKLHELKGHTGGISDIDFSPINSNIIASCSDDLTIRIWSINKGKCLRILKKHTYHVTTIRFNSKGNILISGSADETISIWDLSSGKHLKTLSAHSDPISSICLTPDDSIIVSGSYDGLMRLFDCESGQCLKTLIFNSSSFGTATASTNEVVNFPISHVELSPNGKFILSSSLDGYIRLWDYMDNKVIKTFSGKDNSPISEKFNCSAKFIISNKFETPVVVSGSDKGDLIFWDVQTKRILNIMNFGNEPIFEIDTINNGEALLICSRSGDIRLLKLNT